nr:hypothetical protein [Tanacetum cinerariifolium]GEZ66607.1 hypothetical protein [Tanacetum cinerariifolium]
MDPNTSLGCICMGEQHGILLNDKVESEGHLDGPEFQDTTDNENEKNMISNEFAVKLLLDYEEKTRVKIVKKELLDGEVEIDEEETTKEVIRGYKMIREKNDPEVFVLPILRNKHEESEEDEEEYIVKRDKNAKPIYGPKFIKYLNCDDPMDHALALLEALNPFRKFCVWKKMVSFLGSLPVPLQHNEWISSYSDNFIKKVMVMESGMLKLGLWIHMEMFMIKGTKQKPQIGNCQNTTS